MELFTFNTNINIVIFFIFIYLLYINFKKIDVNKDMLEIIFGAVIGYFIGGFMSGIVHWFMDSYDYEILKERHSYFRNHHIKPTSILTTPNINLLTEISPILIPFLLASYFSNNPLIIMSVSVGAIIGNTSQFFHKYSHLRNHENDTDARGKYLYDKVPLVLKKLQDGNIILNPKEHSIHHDKEIKNYCIAHSNSDRLFEYIFIELLNFRTTLFKNNNQRLKILDRKTREKYTKPTTISDVFAEQIPLIILTILYLIFKFSNT